MCAVTGANGYVGGAIVRFLEARGFRIRRLSRSAGYRLQDPRPPDAFADSKIDVLVHAGYDFSVYSRSEIQRVNVEGSLRLIETAYRCGVRQTIFISSLAAYDGCASWYGRGKHVVEEAVRAQGGHVIRPGTVFGPRARGMMGALLDQAATRTWVPVISHPGSLYLAHEEDLSALVAALAVGDVKPGPVPWLAAGPRAWTLERLVQEMARRTGHRVRTIPVPWRLAWAGLKALESSGLRPSFRSDSVRSIAHPIPPNQLAALCTSTLVSFRDY